MLNEKKPFHFPVDLYHPHYPDTGLTTGLHLATEEEIGIEATLTRNGLFRDLDPDIRSAIVQSWTFQKNFRLLVLPQSDNTSPRTTASMAKLHSVLGSGIPVQTLPLFQPPSTEFVGTMPEQQREWEVNLSTLAPKDIRRLVEQGVFCNDCRYYHSNSPNLKNLGELIAPVDTYYFAKRLIDKYSQRPKTKDKKQKLNVLIPASADRQTIEGILKQLENHDFPLENFHFVLADLCTTPLLDIYAFLKEKGLLGIADIRSMNVFNWGETGEQFDFICCDHFPELFNRDDQEKLLLSLVKSLSPSGELVLTTRCGVKDPLTVEELKNDFDTKAKAQIRRLILELRGREMLEQTANNDHPLQGRSDLEVVRTLASLLIYRQKREVYPFKIVPDLQRLLERVTQSIGGTARYKIKEFTGWTDEGRKPLDKVAIIINR